MTSLRRHLSVFATLALLLLSFPIVAAPVAAASGPVLPSGFNDEIKFSGLTAPTAVAIAKTGRVFVAQKNGRINAYDGLEDSSPTQIADLSVEVYNYWDRGLLGLTADPDFGPSRPYLYALYSYDRILGDSTVPRWNDTCASPTTNGCTSSARLSRLTVSSGGTGNSVSETPMIWDWCIQFPSHTIGTVMFGPEGALYVSGGDGASFTQADYGQLGGNPCGDPTDEGGGLRSQDVRSTGDPTGLDGTVIRIDPDTGDAWPTNANAGSGDENKARIIGYGLRNPFRITVRSSGDVWMGDVGYNSWEEIDRIPDPDASPRNFGWPCYEGNGTLAAYQMFDLPLCTSLSSQSAPQFTYQHSANVLPGDDCSPGSSSIAGLAFLGSGSSYPPAYDDGLFFTDYSRGCIWFAPDSGGNPDFGSISRFADLRPDAGDLGGSVFLGLTPGGNLLYTDYDRGEVHVITYDVNNPPNAEFTSTPDSGVTPLHVNFDASGSSDPDDDPLSYAWDLDGDGAYDDATGRTASRTYTQNGSVNIGLKVTAGGQSDTVHHTIAVGLSKPVATIDEPASSLTWAVGDDIDFSGHATDAQDGDLGDDAFEWTLKVEHCPSNCHEHTIETFEGKSGDFDAPNHDYPSHLRLILKVTDSDGQTDTDSVDIYPKTGKVYVASDPAGIPLTVEPSLGIVGSTSDISAPSSVVLGEETWGFDDWSDGGARAHAADIEAGARHLVASYQWDASADASDTCSGAATVTLPTPYLPGRLASGTDVDWYRFTTTSTRSVQIVLGDLPAAASLKLYHGCSTLLATSDRSGTATEEIIKSLPKGTYRIKVTSKGSSSDAPYYLRVRRASSGLSTFSATIRADEGAGTLTMVGEVWNEYGSTRGPITVTAKLYDEDDNLLSTWKTTTILYATSHSRAPFRLSGSLPDDFYRVAWSESAPVSSKTARGVHRDISTSAEVDSRWKTTGTIKATKGAVKSLKLAMSLYDSRGRIIDVIKGTLGTTALSKNKSTTFTAWSTVPDLDIDRVKVRTFGFKP